MASNTALTDDQIKGMALLDSDCRRHLDKGRKTCLTCMHYFVFRDRALGTCRVKPAIVDHLDNWATKRKSANKRARDCRKWEGDDDV